MCRIRLAHISTHANGFVLWLASFDLLDICKQPKYDTLLKYLNCMLVLIIRCLNQITIMVQCFSSTYSMLIIQQHFAETNQSFSYANVNRLSCGICKKYSNLHLTRAAPHRGVVEWSFHVLSITNLQSMSCLEWDGVDPVDGKYIPQTCYLDKYFPIILGSILWTWLNSAWINNCINYNAWDEITYLFPNISSTTAEVWEWISKFILHVTVYVITYSLKLNHVSKRGQR